MGALGEHDRTCGLRQGCGECTCPPKPPAEPTISAPASADPRAKVWKATDLAAARRVEWLANRRIVAGATNYMLGPRGSARACSSPG